MMFAPIDGRWKIENESEMDSTDVGALTLRMEKVRAIAPDRISHTAVA